MNRRVLDVLAVLSLLLCVAVMVAWTVGESCCTQITFRRADGSYLIVEVPYYVPFILLAAAPSVCGSWYGCDRIAGGKASKLFRRPDETTFNAK